MNDTTRLWQAPSIVLKSVQLSLIRIWPNGGRAVFSTHSASLWFVVAGQTYGTSSLYLGSNLRLLGPRIFPVFALQANTILHLDGSVQDDSNPGELATELLQSCSHRSVTSLVSKLTLRCHKENLQQINVTLNIELCLYANWFARNDLHSGFLQHPFDAPRGVIDANTQWPLKRASQWKGALSFLRGSVNSLGKFVLCHCCKSDPWPKS